MKKEIKNAGKEISKDAKIKDASASKIEIKKDAKGNLSEINLERFSEKLNSMELKEKGERNLLYIYPDGWNKEKINGLEGKNFRNKRRNNLQSLCNNLFFYAKGKNIDALKLEIEKFEKDYKSFYRINDFKLSSLSNSNDEKKNANISFALEIIREMKGIK